MGEFTSGKIQLNHLDLIVLKVSLLLKMKELIQNWQQMNNFLTIDKVHRRFPEHSLKTAWKEIIINLISKQL